MTLKYLRNSEGKISLVVKIAAIVIALSGALIAVGGTIKDVENTKDDVVTIQATLENHGKRIESIEKSNIRKEILDSLTYKKVKAIAKKMNIPDE